MIGLQILKHTATAAISCCFVVPIHGDSSIPARYESGSSESDEATTAESYARSVEPRVLNQALSTFSIGTDTEQLRSYVVNEHPGAFSKDTFEKIRSAFRARSAGLEAVEEGRDPNEVYFEQDLASYEVSMEVWQFDVEQLPRAAEHQEDLRYRVNQTYDDFIMEIVVSETIKSAYVDFALSSAICAQPHVRAKIDRYFESLVPEGFERAVPTKREFNYQCQKFARIWYKEFAEGVVDDNEAPQGWPNELQQFKLIETLEQQRLQGNTN